MISVPTAIVPNTNLSPNSHQDLPNIIEIQITEAVETVELSVMNDEPEHNDIVNLSATILDQ